MGIYYMDVRMVSKAKQSAVAKAAYVSGDKIYSERDEELKHYRTRRVNPDSFILAPSHAPKWVYNRERLWNEAEKIEKPFNAQVQREVLIALPIELNEDQQRELVQEYVQENFVNDGMVADVNIHRDKKENPHAHILLTVRPFNLDGTWWKTKSKKEYILDGNGDFSLNKDGKKRTRKIDLTGWNDKSKLLEWRKSLAEKINEKYKQNGIGEEVSHLSYEQQGKEVVGKNRLKRNEFYVEKKAKEEAEKNGVEYTPVTQYGMLNATIEEYNKQIEILDSKIVSLEEYKKSKTNSEQKAFEEIRKNAVLNSEDKEALLFVKNRSKSSYVDYSVVMQTKQSLAFWERKINKGFRALEQEDKILKQAVQLYKTNPDQLFKIGFDKTYFVEEFNKRKVTYNEMESKLNSELKGFKESEILVGKSLDFQVDLLREEFNFLYPKYENISKFDTEEVWNIMNKYVEEFKETGEIKPVIEFERNELFNTAIEHKFRSEVWKGVLDYHNQSKVHFSLNKQLQNKEDAYKQILLTVKDQVNNTSENREKMYNSTVDYLVTKYDFKNHETEYEKTKNVLYESLVELYGENQKEVIERIPDRFKCKLLEGYLKDGTVETLKEDLSKLDFKLREQKAFIPYENNSSSQAELAGDLFSQLIQQAQDNEKKGHDDLEAQRRRNKRNRKGYKGLQREREM